MNYSNLMEAVNARIKANGRREITGDILNDVLRAMVVELGAGYQLGGTIRPGDKPKVEDLRVAYLTVEPGMYLYAGGFEVTELSLITYGAEWYMYPLGVPFGSQIAEDIAAAVDAEKTRAMAAEKTLSDAIATEARERATADSSLDSAIKAEAKRASDAEGVLTKAVEDEKARAMAAEGANASAITAEADARAKADTTLQGNINTEESERKAADQTLQDNINAEKTRATTAEATLTKNINTESVERKAADTALGTRVASVEDKIPAQATAENKLADKDFVNSSIATATATFRGTFDTLEALKAAQADKNDYAFWVHKDEVGNTCYDKYTYTGTEWLFEYRLNNSSFTAAQWAALNSGVTADVIKTLQDADKANAKAIADEKVAREQADTTLQGNIDKKQNIIVDLPAIREEAANGQTAFSWGDHADAGYVKPFVINITFNDSTQKYEAVDILSADDVQSALNAHNLILLNSDGVILPLTTAFGCAEEVFGITLQFFTIYGDGNEREEYIINIEGFDVTIDYYDYTYATYDQIQSEETERKAADQTLQSNINKKIEPFIINLSGDGSAENPYTVDKTREEVAAALAANSLILLKGEASDFPGYFEIYTLNWATNYPTQALMLQFGNIDEASLIYTTMVLVFSYQEGVGVNVMASSTKLATDEQVKAKQDKLISGTNIKTINGESILGSGDLVVGASTMKAGRGPGSEVFNGNRPDAASGNFSHAEGRSHADGNCSHAEGYGCSTEKENSHAEGCACIARGKNSHAEGDSTVAKRQNSHAEGSYNIQDDAAIHSVGIGSTDARKDAHRITYDGKHYIIGIGGFDGTKATENLTNEKDLATIINNYESRIAALETALAGIKSN